MALARYCAYQERCVQEVQTKMADLGLMPSDFPDYLQWLAKNNYLHEGRFAEIYVRSKFNQKHWGRQKINFELRKRGISESLVLSAWESITDNTYSEQLNKI
jgi:regulatory protein